MTQRGETAAEGCDHHKGREPACRSRGATGSLVRCFFVLEQSLAVSGGWAQVSSPYATNATDISISVPAPTGNQFYRLRKL